MAGQRMDDHSFWAGGKSKGSVFPDGVKHKMEKSAEGSGHVGTDYPDTTEAIHRDQMHSDKQAKKQKMKPGQRY